MISSQVMVKYCNAPTVLLYSGVGK